MFANVAQRKVTIQELSEAFYKMAQDENAPRCIKSLVWFEGKEHYRCYELEDNVTFIMALQKLPFHRI